jgi:hypothetical protein
MGRRASLLSADALWASEAQLKIRMLCGQPKALLKSNSRKRKKIKPTAQLSSVR